MAVVLYDDFEGPAQQYVMNRPGWSVLPGGHPSYSAMISLDGAGNANSPIAMSGSNGGAVGCDIGSPDQVVTVTPNYPPDDYCQLVMRVSSMNPISCLRLGFRHNLGIYLNLEVNGVRSNGGTFNRSYVAGDTYRFEFIGEWFRAYQIRGGNETLLGERTCPTIPLGTWAGISTWGTGGYNEITFADTNPDTGGGPGGSTPNHGLLALF